MARPRLSEEEKRLKGTYRKDRDPGLKPDFEASPLVKYNRIHTGILHHSPGPHNYKIKSYYAELYRAWECMYFEALEKELALFDDPEVKFGKGRAQEKKELRELLGQIMRGRRIPNPFAGRREEWIGETREDEQWLKRDKREQAQMRKLARKAEAKKGKKSCSK